MGLISFLKDKFSKKKPEEKVDVETYSKGMKNHVIIFLISFLL